MTRATLSAVIPNYNHGHVLEAALRSVLAQSRPADEVLVVDDGSTDDSVATIEKICRKNPVVRLIKCDRNYGLPAALNRGLREANGEYVCFPAADRVALPGYFEMSMAMLERYPQAGLSFGTPAWVDGLQGEFRQAASPKLSEAAYLDPSQVVGLERSSRFLISDGTVIVKRKALLELGGFDPELRWSGCWFAYVAIGFRYGLCYLPTPPLIACKLDRNSYSAAGGRDRQACREIAARVAELLRSSALADVAASFRETGVVSVLAGRAFFITDKSARQFINGAGAGLIVRKELGRLIRAYLPFAAKLVEAYRARHESKRVPAAIAWPNS